MTTESQTNASVSKTNMDTINIGNRLKSKRLELEFDERYVATALKIPIDQVRALEANDFKYFRSVTFARGFLKSYCRLLGIEHTEMLHAFDSSRELVETTIKPVDKVNKQKHLGDPIIVFISIVIVAVLVFLVFWWPAQFTTVALEEQQIEASESASMVEPNMEAAQTLVEPTVSPESPEESSDVPASTSENAPEAIANDNDSDVSDNASDLGVSVVDEQPAESSPVRSSSVVTGLSAETMAILEEAGVRPEDVIRATAEVPSTPVPTVPSYTDEVEVAFSADCWTEVRDATGKILFSGVKTASSNLSLTGKAPYRVVFGYARGVSSLKFKGEVFDFSSSIRNDLARFELK
ncbi:MULTISPECIES: RodZ domain-containing protein [Marinomonas]|nr:MULTISPECIES: RodZ domain-containing protein [Marinomonas]